MDKIQISPKGRKWAIQHNGGYLGYAGSREEALRIAEDLISWLAGKGRPVELLEAEPIMSSGLR